MSDTDKPFTVTECPRCGALILTGRLYGLTCRVDRYAVPPVHGRVLRHYGVPLVVLTRRPTGGTHADYWTRDHDLTHPDRHLVVPHVCGSAHTLREEFS